MACFFFLIIAIPAVGVFEHCWVCYVIMASMEAVAADPSEEFGTSLPVINM
jgi:hypothetical protein